MGKQITRKYDWIQLAFYLIVILKLFIFIPNKLYRINQTGQVRGAPGAKSNNKNNSGEVINKRQENKQLYLKIKFWATDRV